MCAALDDSLWGSWHALLFGNEMINVYQGADSEFDSINMSSDNA